jgi:MFS family permease
VTKAYSNYVLGLLFFVYVVNFIDRQVLSIMLPAIKADLGVSDTYMGFLAGFAFALFYTFAGIPIARLADRRSRSGIISLGLLVWTTMTAASGMVQSFWQLAAARVGVAVGEAAGSPPAHSLLSDYFPPERRATALSLYGTGVYIGVAVAFIGGGYIAQEFGWRSVYLSLGLLGLPLALIVRLTVRELPRGISEKQAVTLLPVPFGEAVRRLAGNRTFVFVVLATSLQSLAGYGILTWGPTFLMRVHGLGGAETGLQLGIAVGTMGTLGAYLGGKWADAMARRDERWYMRLPAIQAVVSLPLVVGFILAEDPTVSLMFFYPFYLIGAMYIGPMFSVIQTLVVPNMRATASAVNLFVVNMIGLGLGPFLIGLMNDTLAADYGDGSIRYSLLIAAAAGGLAAPLFYRASQTIPEDFAAARAASSGASAGASSGEG